jgi:hypothetical protein
MLSRLMEERSRNDMRGSPGVPLRARLSLSVTFQKVVSGVLIHVPGQHVVRFSASWPSLLREL